MNILMANSHVKKNKLCIHTKNHRQKSERNLSEIQVIFMGADRKYRLRVANSQTPRADSKQDAWKIALPRTVTGMRAVDVYSTSV